MILDDNLNIENCLFLPFWHKMTSKFYILLKKFAYMKKMLYLCRRIVYTHTRNQLHIIN